MNERQAIEGYIEYIKEERTRVSNLFRDMVAERMKLEEMYKNQMDSLMRDYKAQLDRLRQLDEIDNARMEEEVKLASLVAPPAPAQEIKPVIQEIKPQVQEIKSDVQAEIDKAVALRNASLKEQKPAGAPFKYDPEKERIRERDYRERVSKKGKRGTVLDMAKVTRDVVDYLKSRGTPVKTKEILNHLRNNGHTLNSPYEVFRRVRDNNPKIQSITHGFYQYKY
ncbi:hypothetical protein CPT_Mater168 [Bacillus phage Mater]|uniref:Repressor Rok winged helix domain-containing protein n=1 Tax=Bacillus phage Mater TaxID=1540090 RepID=A0A0A0RMN4_9CAUD|nr:hypothetical protein CPT_Mater168 [Bacillus phage Mater]AIW03325.1 hypothetical protein CPT_Mater168 [Bacillus phage Mater]